MMLGLIVILIMVLMITFGYLYYHIDKVLPVEKYHKTISFGVLCIFLVLMYLSDVVLGFVVHLLIVFVFLDIGAYFVNKTKFKKYFQIEIIAVIIASILTGYGVYNIHHYQYIQYDVYIDKSFEEKRILAISDLHLSTAVHDDDLKWIEKKVNERHVDMIVILGDLFDERTKENEAKKAIQFFDKLASSYPVYYIVGNHDGSQGRLSIDEGWLKWIDESQIVFLKDEVVHVQGINMIGRLDKTYQRKDVKTLIENINHNEPIILLDHQPRQTKENAMLGVDLQLSGHTHNGQIWPLGTLCKMMHINEVEYGHEQVNDMDVIVSSGLGAWGFAMKSQGNSEIVEINLKQK